MQSDSEVRRHSDGSIDFSYYRRNAARLRRRARRVVVRSVLTRAAKTVRAGFSALRAATISLSRRHDARAAFRWNAVALIAGLCPRNVR
jgi:hypothetical protein